MQLDTTMLQSNTAQALVKYIDKLMWTIIENGELTEEMKEDYEEIKTLHAEAWKRRSIRYRTDLN